MREGEGERERERERERGRERTRKRHNFKSLMFARINPVTSSSNYVTRADPPTDLHVAIYKTAVAGLIEYPR